MAARVSVIIPALNEEALVATAVRSAFAAGVFEVIVSDGGSSDGTVAAAQSAGARIITGAQMRAEQLNRGAESAAGDHLIFLHADTILPREAAACVTNARSSGFLFGGFRIAFAERASKLKFAAAMINLRTLITRCPWGDQAQFIGRATFLDDGGYREIPLMEDYELARRMRRRGRTTILPLYVVTSGRRFLARGVLRASLTNWRIIAAWHRGADPAELARIYRGSGG